MAKPRMTFRIQKYLTAGHDEELTREYIRIILSCLEYTYKRFVDVICSTIIKE